MVENFKYSDDESLVAGVLRSLGYPEDTAGYVVARRRAQRYYAENGKPELL